MFSLTLFSMVLLFSVPLKTTQTTSTPRPPPSTTLPPSTTPRPPPSTTLPQSTTPRPPPSTTLPQSTTPRPPPSTTLPQSTTPRPPPSTTLPPPTTPRPIPIEFCQVTRTKIVYGIITRAKCTATYCLNGGKCFCKRIGYTSYIQVCKCPHGYIGRRCETDMNPCRSNPCGTGACVRSYDSQRGYSYACICPPGFVFTGTICIAECPIGTVEFKDVASNTRLCYYGVFKSQTWLASQTSCASLYANGNLANVPSQAAHNFISGHFINFRRSYWIGINDRHKEGVFVYLRSNGPVPETQTAVWTNWVTGQPNNLNNEDCTEVLLVTKRWNDRRCSRLRHALCSITLSP